MARSAQARTSSSGWARTRLPSGSVPPGVVVHAYVPMSTLLPEADVVAHHGGSGTMLAALAAGTPMIIVPLAADQPDNGDRCEAAGVARVLSPDGIDAATVHAAIEGSWPIRRIGGARARSPARSRRCRARKRRGADRVDRGAIRRPPPDVRSCHDRRDHHRPLWAPARRRGDPPRRRRGAPSASTGGRRSGCSSPRPRP